MRRWASNILAGLSLLLCLAVVCVWVRSYWRTEGWWRFPYFVEKNEYRQDRISLRRGRVDVSLWSFTIDSGFIKMMKSATEAASYDDTSWTRERGDPWRPEREHWWEFLGLYVRLQKNVRSPAIPGTGSQVFVSIPYWLLVAVTAIAPGLWGMQYWRKRRRKRKGMCRNCGYDLRASPDRCPECGYQPDKAAADPASFA